MARSVECKCDERTTCAYCCRNAKPYFFTVTDKPLPKGRN